MTVGEALLTITPALAVAYGVGVLHGFVMSSSGVSGAPRVPAHSTVVVSQPRPANKAGDEYTAGMGGKTVREPRGGSA